MKQVLIINASPRNKKSHSKKLTQRFVNNWEEKYPDDAFIYREVGLNIIPPIDEKWIASAFIEPKDRTKENQQNLALSNILVEELQKSDIYVIGTPMYNWSIPSGLKAYIDQIMRINETWKFPSGKPDGNYIGLLENKKLFILSSRGDSGYNEGEKNEHMNYQTTYLKFIFSIMGVKDIEIISLDNEEYGGELFSNSQRKICEKIGLIK
jgi:FMN-dependent NADH-azoreductase